MKFNPGDVLLYTSPHLKFKYLLAHGIRLVEGSQIIHVAIYLDNNFIIEALDGKVQIKYLPELINRTNGMVLYGTATLSNTSIVYQDIYAIASLFNNKPYGYLTDINILFQHGKCLLFPKKPWTVWFKSRNGYMCSETALLIYQALGNKFPKLACLTEPNDLLKAPWTVTKI